MQSVGEVPHKRSLMAAARAPTMVPMMRVLRLLALGIGVVGLLLSCAREELPRGTAKLVGRATCAE